MEQSCTDKHFFLFSTTFSTRWEKSDVEEALTNSVISSHTSWKTSRVVFHIIAPCVAYKDCITLHHLNDSREPGKILF